MELEKKLKRLKNELLKSKEDIAKIFGNRVEKIQTDEIKEKVEHFKEIEIDKINKGLDHAVTVLESPVYVGLLGRYSHGKTALVNTLFSLEEEYTLPEGEGIVTSKITRVEFDNSSIIPKCFEHYRDGKEKSIEISALKSNVSGKFTDEDSGMIDYYHLKISSKEAFARLFEKKKINLIDMPGLGGPYFKDTEKTKIYIKNVDMLLAIINITDINNAGRVIEPYIRDISIPIIPVLTFFDQWKECAKFTKCTNEEEAIEEAKKQIREYIPSLAKNETRIIAVSSKDGFQINNLRDIMLNFVEEQNFAIGKIKKEETAVFKNKIREIAKALGELVVNTENSLNKLKRDIVSILPETREFEHFEKYFIRIKDKALKEAKKKIKRTTKDIFSDFRDKVSEIRYKKDYNEISSAIKKLEHDINRNSIKDIRYELNDIFLGFIDDLKTYTEKYVDKLEIDNSEKEELKENMFEIINNGSIDTEEIGYEAPELATDMFKDYTKTLLDSFFTTLTNPQFLMPIGICAVIGFVFIWFKWVPFLGKGLVLLGYIMIGGGVLGIFFGPFLLNSSAKKNRFNEAKNNIIDKLLTSFDRQKIKEDANNSLTETVNDLIKEIDEELREKTSPYSKDLKILKEISKEFKGHIERLNKTLSRELETLEGSR